MPYAAAAAAAAALGGAYMQSQSAEDASSAQGQASGAAINASTNQARIARNDSAPYRDAGTAALSKIRDLLGINSGAGGVGASDWKTQLKKGYADSFAQIANPNSNVLSNIYDIIDKSSSPTDASAYGENVLDFAKRTGVAAPANLGDILSAPQPSASPAGATGAAPNTADSILAMDPGYQFRLDQGNKAVTNAAGAAGMRNSGATLKALTRYGQDYASGEFGNVVNRLAGLAGTGQTAQAGDSSLGANMAMNVGNIFSSQGNARGAASIAQGNAYGGAAQSIGNWYNQQQMMNRFFPQGGGQQQSNPNGTYGGEVGGLYAG